MTKYTLNEFMKSFDRKLFDKQIPYTKEIEHINCGYSANYTPGSNFPGLEFKIPLITINDNPEVLTEININADALYLPQRMGLSFEPSKEDEGFFKLTTRNVKAFNPTQIGSYNMPPLETDMEIKSQDLVNSMLLTMQNPFILLKNVEFKNKEGQIIKPTIEDVISQKYNT